MERRQTTNTAMKNLQHRMIAGAAVSAAALCTATVALGQTQSAPQTYVQPAPTYATGVTQPAVHPRIVTTNVGADNETGVDSADQERTTTQKLIDGARAVRQELMNDPATANEDIRISPLNGRISLSGTVSAESVKSKAEAIANHAAPSCTVVSYLKAQHE